MELINLRLRSDLVICRQDKPEGIMFVIKDPALNRFFRFKEIEHFIAQQFDGSTSPDTMRQRVEERFGVALSSENLEQFGSRLHRIGLLTDGVSLTQAMTQRRVAGDLFYLRCKLFDPDKFFDWLLPQIRFLFTPYFLISSALLVILAINITTASWPHIMRQFYGLFHFESLLLAWFVILGVVTLHEFAHGLTCKYFGGRVREIGFMLIYFQPAFYCNVSDAWLFPHKAHRLWVTFAGAYFEVFLWALATITWRLTDPSTSLNHFALVVTATSAFKMFFNMNPLIKLDGYYLLSDWLDIPNLRQKASSYLGNTIRKLWGGARKAQEVTPREQWIYLTYALLSGIYIYWLLGNIALWFGGHLVTNYQGWGFLLFTTTILFLFRNNLKKIFLSLTAQSTNGNSVTTESNSNTEQKKKRLRLPNYVKFLLALGSLLAALFYFHGELRISGPFTVLPRHNADVRAEVEGIIEEIYADEGDFVEKGTILARLSDRDYNAELNKTQAEIEAKQATLRLLMSGARPEEIELARTHVAKAGELLAFAQGHLERDQFQVEQKLISIEEFEESKELAAVREREVHEAKERLKILLAGNRPEEIEALEADIRSLEAHESHLQQQLQSLHVVSPIAGVVTTHKLREKIGENVKRGDLIAEVFELKSVLVEIAIPEKEIGEVKVGQVVTLKARAYPHEWFDGKVISIAPVATKPSEWEFERTILVTTQLDNTSGLLKPEMTGNAKIYCGQHRLIDLVTRRFVRYFRVEFWSWW